MPKKKNSDNEIYTAGEWKGMPQLRCNFCQWDTLDGEQAILDHYVKYHVAPEPVERPSIVPAYDRHGNPITVMVKDQPAAADPDPDDDDLVEITADDIGNIALQKLAKKEK